MVQAELWTSWAAVLRSYTALHGLGSSQPAVTEISLGSITLRVGSRWLRFTATATESSDGSIHSFHLNEDGTVSREGRPDEQMDLAAEEIAREMMHPTA